MIRPLLAAAVVTAGLGYASSAAAQEDRLDRTRLIEGLGERELVTLRKHYLDQVRDKLDPIEAAQLDYQDQMMLFRRADRSTEAGQYDALEALREAVNLRVKLIEDNPEHRLRPMWQTDLAALLFEVQVPDVGRNAAMFYEFGLPDEEQRELFEDAAITALRMTGQAYTGFDDLQGLMGRKPEVRAELEATGLMTKIEQYREARTPFYLAHASYYASLLPDTHPYFQAITDGKKDPQFPNRASTIKDERRRLLAEAYDLIEPFARDANNPFGIQKPAQSLAGRALIAMGEIEKGNTQLRPVLGDANKAQLYHFAASLAVPFGMAKENDFGGATDALDEVKRHPLVKQAFLFPLLIADAEHRIMMMEIETKPEDQRKASLPVAYQPYLDLLRDTPEDKRGLMQVIIFTRWEKGIDPEADITAYPEMVRLAVAEMSQARGTRLASKAQDSGEAADAEEAIKQFDRVTEAAETLIAEDISDEVRAKGTYALASALINRELLLGEEADAGNLIRGAALAIKVARELPEQPVAENAMALGVFYSRKLHMIQEQQGKIAGVDQLYGEAAGVLFEQFDDTEIADKERVYYAQVILQANKKYLDAAKMYARVPFDSQEYFLAQGERVFCLESHWKQIAAGADRELARQQVVEAANELDAEAERVAEESRDPIRKTDARRARSVARIVSAGMMTDAQDYDGALKVLDGFEEENADDPLYVPMALERRIIALVEANRIEAASAEAQKMMDAYPNEASGIVNDVLVKLEGEIDDLSRRIEREVRPEKKQEHAQTRTDKAGVAVVLSELLLKWAQGQGFAEDEMLLYRMPVVKAMRLSGKTAEALPIIKPLATDAANEDNPLVLYEYAETLFAIGGEENLKTAAKIYRKLIGGLQQDRPAIYWQSWIRVFEITEALGSDQTKKIPGRVRWLENTIDRELGGPRFKAQLKELEAKHASQ